MTNFDDCFRTVAFPFLLLQFGEEMTLHAPDSTSAEISGIFSHTGVEIIYDEHQTKRETGELIIYSEVIEPFTPGYYVEINNKKWSLEAVKNQIGNTTVYLLYHTARITAGNTRERK